MAKSASLIALLVFVAAATACPEFNAYRTQFGKSYRSADEAAAAGVAFCDNLAKMQELAASNPRAAFAPNHFMDIPAAAFKQFYHGLRLPANVGEHLAKLGAVPAAAYGKVESAKAANKTVDWTSKGAVTKVKNQLECGSCWAFSSTGNLEGQWYLAGNDLVSLSEQNLLDCDTVDQACNGGLMTNAFEFIQKEGGIDSEASYPYAPATPTGPCLYNVSNKAASVDGVTTVPSDEDEMAAWVAKNGPLSVAVDATSWQTYAGGILTNAVAVQVDHGVLVVGYGEEAGQKYWKIKNSWGAAWGEEGYIRIARGVDSCLITTLPVSAKVPSSGKAARSFSWE